MRVGRPNPSEIVKRLVEIGATRLTEDAGVPAEQARFVMREVAHEFCAEWGGDRVYLPKDVELPLEIGRSRFTEMLWPIAIRPSGNTALAVAIEQTLSTRLAITPPCMIAIG